MRAPNEPGREQPTGPVAGVVLDRPAADEAAAQHLAALAVALFDGGVSHLSLVGAGAAIAPDTWAASAGRAAFEPAGLFDLAGQGEARHFRSGPQCLTLLPDGSGRAVVLAAARSLAAQNVASAQVETVDAAVREIAGPPADLVIVTGGTKSLHGAYTWSAAYAEFVFLSPPWRDLAPEDVVRALREFAQRSRRYGGIAVAESR